MTFLRVSYQSETGENGDITFVFRALHEAVTFPVFGTGEHISASVGDIPERPHLAMIFAVPYNSGGVCPGCTHTEGIRIAQAMQLYAGVRRLLISNRLSDERRGNH